MKSPFGLACLLFFVLAASPVAAGVDSWSFVGAPPNGDVRLLRIAPSAPHVLYASDEYGKVFRSGDGGDTWEWSVVDGVSRPILGLAIAPTDPDIVYCVLSGERGTFKSVDGGKTWTQLSHAFRGYLSSNRSIAIAISPTNPDVLHINSMKSRDGGKTWAPYCPDSNPCGVGSITLHLMDENILFGSAYWPLGDFSGGDARVVRSLDGGSNWKATTAPAAVDFVFDPTDPRTIYAATKDKGVYKSRDGGDTWTQHTIGLTYGRRNNLRELATIEIDPDDSEVLYVVGRADFNSDGRLFKSSDAGETWENISADLTETATIVFTQLAVGPNKRLLLVFGSPGYTHGQVYESVDGGATWQLNSNEISQGQITGYGRTSRDALIFLGTNKSGEYFSRDRGATWQPIVELDVDVELLEEEAITAHPLQPRVLISGNRISLDDGRYWEDLENGISLPFEFEREAVIFDPDDPQLLYAFTIAGLYSYRFSQTPQPFPPQPTASVDTLSTLGNWTHYPLGPISHLTLDADDRVWFSGLQLGRIEAGEVELLPPPDRPSSKFDFPHPLLAIDAQNHVWAVSNYVGRFDGHTWEYFADKVVKHLDRNGERYDFVSILTRPNGEVWFGTRDYSGWAHGGLYLMKDGKIEKVIYDNYLMDLKNTNIIVEDARGTLWVGTGA